ncbi:ribonuclease HI [Paraburkholderia sp. BL27I4N3]|uniref:ribonuclease HI n=1 Tax=Paraburkholderia sp. BL27I4N3 TaxID=1938805 RepID=UPI000E2528B7|nr:ribonuclease H [Paraburkholderia sp. BL27I4N3]REE17751.1 ribonuclease HI [Paraburkholderia sp. BL27I4N3]
MQGSNKTETERLERDVINAALTWYQMPGGLSERALTVAVESLLRGREGGKNKPVTDAPAQEDFLSSPAEQTVTTLTMPTVAGNFVVYSDGSALKNPGPSGCGWVVVSDGKVVYEGFEAIGHGTNQIAEIRAAAHGLNDLPVGSTVDVHTDSLYVVKTMRGEFRKKANIEHWAFLDEAVRRHKAVKFHHVRGHAGHDLNERADVLANKGSAISKARLAGKSL